MLTQLLSSSKLKLIIIALAGAYGLISCQQGCFLGAQGNLGPAGQICFKLSLPNCMVPPGTQLCMHSNSCETPPQEDYYLQVNNDWQCCQALPGPFPFITCAATWTPRNGTPQQTLNFSRSYSSLFYFEYGRYPTSSELSAITLSQAESWFAAYFAWLNQGIVYSGSFAMISGESETQVSYPPCQLCFTKWINPCGGGQGVLGPAFAGCVVFPDGDSCKIQDVNFDDQTGTDPCANSTAMVKLRPGCAECN